MVYSSTVLGDPSTFLRTWSVMADPTSCVMPSATPSLVPMVAWMPYFLASASSRASDRVYLVCTASGLPVAAMASLVASARMLSVVTLSVDLMDVSEFAPDSARADIPRPDCDALNDARRWRRMASMAFSATWCWYWPLVFRARLMAWMAWAATAKSAHRWVFFLLFFIGGSEVFFIGYSEIGLATLAFLATAVFTDILTQNSPSQSHKHKQLVVLILGIATMFLSHPAAWLYMPFLLGLGLAILAKDHLRL